LAVTRHSLMTADVSAATAVARDGYGGWAPDTDNKGAAVAVDKTTVYTLQEVSRHVTQRDAWISVQGNVYDISPFIRSHWGHIGGGSGALPCIQRGPPPPRST
jgi:cytochrome b involved in lipid metabolism